VENIFFSYGICKKGTSSMHRKMEKGPLCKIAWGETNLAITQEQMNLTALDHVLCNWSIG
jgi:hypothetical protein